MNRGFTLIELLIVVAIVAIVGMVVYPIVAGNGPDPYADGGQSVQHNGK
jgi:prepilin-type N-terminal cleavage/methylation domain-containing protein